MELAVIAFLGFLAWATYTLANFIIDLYDDEEPPQDTIVPH